MPAISKIRFTHVLYEGGNKRYNDETFLFDGHNGAVVLENGGGKTVFIQTALQAMLPHTELAGRKLKDTLMLENGPAHIAIEWILNDKPRRRYTVTCVSLFLNGNGIDSYRYAYEYGEHDNYSLDHIPFVKEYLDKTRPSDRGEIQEYYASMMHRFPLKARTFGTIKEYKAYLEENFHIVASEWEAVVKINDTEGGIEAFFDECKATSQLFDRLLIPTVEQAMEGYEKDGFAKMFESHRDGFKRYKELKEQIEENKLILHELGQYVLLYEKLNKAEEIYTEAREEAKAYKMLTRLQLEEQRAEQESLKERIADWIEQEKLLQRKLKSLELAEAEQSKSIIEKSFLQLQEEAEGLHERLKQALRYYYSMQYAELRSKWELAQARLIQFEQQLSRLEMNEDEQQLQERCERNGARLHYLYAQQEKETEQTLKEYSSEINGLKQEITETEKQIENIQNEIRSWELLQQVNLAKQDEKIQQQQELAHMILANPALEQVEQQISIWSARQQQLEEERISHLSLIKQLSEERTLLLENQKASEEEIRGFEQTKILLEQKLEQIKTEHTDVIRRLATLRPSWDRLSSVYDKEASLMEQLKEGIARRQEQKETQWPKERLAYRFVDDYYEQDIFFADPSIERMVKSWGRQFALLQTGPQYLSDIEVELDGREWTTDRLWAVTLVTTDSEKMTLKQKLEAAKDQFSYPIRVLSVSEAAVHVQSYQYEDHKQWIVPSYWQSNGNLEAFQKWKEGLQQHAELIKGERESKEEDLKLWENINLRLCEFLEKYPLSQVQSYEQQLHEIREKLIRLFGNQKQGENRLQQLEESLEKYRAELMEKQEYIHQYDQWLKDGQRYLVLGVEVKRLEKELLPIQDQVKGLQGQLRMKTYSLKRAKEEMDSVQGVYSEWQTKLVLLRSDELYRIVQSYHYEESSFSLVELKEEYKVLERERDGLIKARKELELERIHEREKVIESEKAIQQLIREHPDLDTQASLPIELDEAKQNWWSRIEQYRKQVELANERVEEQRLELHELDGKIGTLKQQFLSQYSGEEPSRFEQELSVVKSNLQRETEMLEHNWKELQQRKHFVEKQFSELESIVQLWEKHTLLHKLDDGYLRPSQLEEKQLIEFNYARMSYSEKVVVKLQSRFDAVDKEKGLVRKGKDRFKSFCMSNIKDVKLRQMAMQGVELKEAYEEVVEFQLAMQNRIQKAIHIMEETIQTYDRDLQQFIKHIHIHLKQVVQELRELPKKTRIRTADGWREIYSFSIPEWDDQEGKDRIREHIEWILSQLERTQYGDENSTDFQNDIRKNLSKWLDSKQLLQVVLKTEAMKVMCRKVTNDHQVTKAAYSWEQSNRWSGGEKWSKNMTLFLGLLNYVAERKQFIKANMKLHRTVILDNPFGKASSDHVLSPVFFIAEQLGFQIIALTAHAEGKFLQDYFPIVYSCRLRSTFDASKQIVESTKRIQHAYFRDNAPDTLTRIDARVGQITLL